MSLTIIKSDFFCTEGSGEIMDDFVVVQLSKSHQNIPIQKIFLSHFLEIEFNMPKLSLRILHCKSIFKPFGVFLLPENYIKIYLFEQFLIQLLSLILGDVFYLT